MNINVDPENKTVEFAPNDIDQIKRRRYQERLAGIVDSSSFSLLTLTYIILSLILANNYVAPSGLNAWAVFWPLIILGGVPGSIMRMINKKKLTIFPIWSIAAAAYLFIGMFASMWHPYWVILLIIPVYYSIVGPIDSFISDKKKGRI